MGKHRKIFERLMRGTADADLAFSDLCQLLRRLGFDERIRGDHYIFSKQDVDEILILQPRGGLAKPYPVKHVRNLIHKYSLNIEDKD